MHAVLRDKFNWGDREFSTKIFANEKIRNGDHSQWNFG